MPGDDELVQIQLRLKDARKFISDAKRAERGVKGIGDETAKADRRGRVASVGFGMFTKSLQLLKVAVIGAVTVLGTLVTVGFGKSIMAASNLTEAVNKTTVVFDKSKDGVIAWSKTTALGFGISQRAALDAAGVFGNMLVPMGILPKEAATMSMALTELGGDMASFNNASPQEVLDALRSGLSGETEPLRKFGVFLSAANIEAKAAAMGLKKVGGEFTQASKTTAAYNLILEQTKLQQGDVARSASTSLAVSWSKLKAVSEDIAASLGAKFLPKLVELVQVAIKMLGTFDRARKSGASFGFAIATAMDGAAGGGTRFREAFVQVSDIVTRVWGALGNLGAGVRDIVAAFLPAKSEGDAVGDVLTKLATTVETGTVKFREFGAWMRKGSTGAKALRAVVLTLVAAYAAWKVGVAAWTVVTKVATAVSKAVRAAIVAWNVAVKVAVAVNRLFTIGMLALNMAFLANPVGVVVIAVIALAAAFVLAYKKVEWFRNAVNAAIGFIRTHWKALFVILTGPIGLAVLLIVKHRDKIVAAFKSSINWIRDNWKGILAILTGPIGLAVYAITKKWDKIKDGFRRMIDYIKEAWNAVASKLSIDGVEIKGVTIVPEVRLPMLANGGVLTAPGPVVVGDGGNGSGAEVLDLPRGARVRPLSPDERSVRRFAGGSAGGDGRALRVEVPVYIDGKHVGDAIADVTSDELARR